MGFCGFCTFPAKTLRVITRDWSQTWCIHYGIPPGLINFWSCSFEFPLFPSLWLVEQFQCISIQTFQGIDLKLGRYIHYGTPQGRLTFGHALLNSRCFLASDWSSIFHAFADKPLIVLSSDLVGQLINSFAPGRCSSNFKSIIFKFIVQNSDLGTHAEISQITARECHRTLQMSQHWFR